ncbi:retropepsin-like aspartic protease [Pararcticibacter amylolyticus]|uniref:Peptidase A2 domain-containing protein n=1 Tax=Pararcticibacter amylolyticus TaxID=2173175 RepID=A0A2U2PA11_9SPHI|nr:retropepsin-like aspartic protease [Pararcticibacter amylolyticus]PWG77969.1 hypothetical protein DDR33_24670 [Pararcticibacter amylolyticus]
MRRYFLLLILLCFNAFCYGQAQRNYAQELYNLLLTGRNFEAREFKLQHKAQLPPDLDLVYNMHMSLAFNKPDSTIIYFEEFLGDPYRVRTIGPVVGQYYVRLCETYEGKQQFEKAISAVEKHINYLKINPYSLAPEAIKNETIDAQNKILLLKEKLKNEPIRRIIRSGKDIKIKLKDDTYIRFDAQYNGHTVETFFDTGVTEFCIMEKDLADEISVKYKSKQDSIRLINGKPIKAIEGYIDSIELDGLKFYNIPVVVLLDKFTSHLPGNMNSDFKQKLENKLLKSKQIILGLPTIKMLGRFEIDWKINTIVIPQKKVQKPIERSSNSNLMFIKNALYLNMKINETPFTGFLDLGADHYLFLTYPYFFKSNCEYVKYDTAKQPYTRTGFVDSQENMERYRVENPQIYMEGRKIDTARPQREVYTVANINNFDGEVGVGFFKNTFSKTVIDFNNMIVECEE